MMILSVGFSAGLVQMAEGLLHFDPGCQQRFRPLPSKALPSACSP
jgi:hypothetical protein